MAQNDDVVRVTLEDVEGVTVAPAASPAHGATAPAQADARNWGNINAAEPSAPLVSEERGSILLQGWFYLGVAGVLGTLIGWSVCEPAFVDGGEGRGWGNLWMVPLTIMLMLVAFAISESIVERSWKKAGMRLGMVVPIGLIFGFVFSNVANIVYNVGLSAIYSMGVRTWHNPAWWITRGIAWMVFGLAGGIVYGLVGRSAKKGRFGVIGGVIGAGLGGVLFDPIAIWVDQGALSRCIGFGFVGLATGAAMGFVESALKDRWIYVSSGPLAGKQFILYKPLTTIGSRQDCDIYLFKDSTIAPEHATIELRGTQAYLRSVSPVYVSGVPTQQKVLLSGETIQIGRYAFRYNERHRF
jgi:hypothetical protein